jgi:hypothetical protein
MVREFTSQVEDTMRRLRRNPGRIILGQAGGAERANQQVENLISNAKQEKYM